MPFRRKIAVKSDAGQGAQGEKKKIPPSQSADLTIFCSLSNRGPKLYNDPQHCRNGEQE